MDQTKKMDVAETLRGLASVAMDLDTQGFLPAMVDLLPELWRMFQRHRGDVKAMRQALREQDDLLARGRADVDAALAAKAAAGGGSE